MRNDLNLDYILGGSGYGDVGRILEKADFDMGALRPFVTESRKDSWVTITNNGKQETVLAPNEIKATLLKDEWIQLDEEVIRVSRERLGLVRALREKGLVHNLPNGMGHSALRSQNISDITDAQLSMDGLQRGDDDRPVFDFETVPLPIAHKYFEFSLREIETSRNGAAPIDTTMIADSTRKVLEIIDQLAIGNLDNTPYTFGGHSVYGINNFPQRNVKMDVLAPDDESWTPDRTLKDILSMKTELGKMNHYGPYSIFVSPNWDEYLDQDYVTPAQGGSGRTLRQRILDTRAFDSIVTLDQLGTDSFQIFLIEMSSFVIREIIGMEVMPIQWPTHGGLQQNFEVMAIQIPQLRADHSGNTGISHGTTS